MEDEDKLSIKNDPTVDDNDDKKDESNNNKEEDEKDEKNVDDDKSIEDTESTNHIPSELQNSQEEDDIRDVEKHPNGQITFNIRGKSIALR